jgi:transposase
MVAPLNTCTTIEQHGVVQFLWAKGMAAKDIHKEMLPMYGEHCLSCQAVHNWVQKFSEGRTSIEDEHRVGRPVEIATPATLQRVEDNIRADRRVTIDAVATAIGCSHPLLPYLLPTKTVQRHTVLSWYTYSGGAAIF